MLLKFENLTQAGVLNFSTTKKGWSTQKPTRFTGDEPEKYLLFREELAGILSISAKNLVFPRQVHGDHIVIVTALPETDDIPETDALITDCKDLCICVQEADCVPILLYDENKQVIAAVHAGWRGTVKKIAAKVIEKMIVEFGCNPKHILAGIGPSIQQQAYEVGPEVIAIVKDAFKDHHELLLHEGKFDLQEANKSLLENAGLHDHNIEIMDYCSFSQPHLFYSARRDGVQTGRMATGIML